MKIKLTENIFNMKKINFESILNYFINPPITKFYQKIYNKNGKFEIIMDMLEQ